KSVANVVRRALVDSHFDIPDVPAKRLVIRGRANRLGTGHDNHGRARDAAKLATPVVARHQKYEFADISRVVLGGLVEKPLDEAGIHLVERQPVGDGFGEEGAQPLGFGSSSAPGSS